MNDQVTLLISAGNGPGECELAVGFVLDHLIQEAEDTLMDVDVSRSEGANGPKSALVVLHGAAARRLAAHWIGTIQWTCQSPLRPRHKRKNWFVAVFECPAPVVSGVADAGFRFDTFRAGGAGGQHQNTTDSAVRATCLATGLSVVVRDGRSQHQNKALAIKRLAHLKAAQADLEATDRQRELHHLHSQLERGNPKRRFQGPRFREMT